MKTRDGVTILGWDEFYSEVLLDGYSVVSRNIETVLPNQFVSGWLLGARVRNENH